MAGAERGSCSGEYAAGALPCKNISVSCSTRRSRRFTRSPAVCGREASKRPARFCNLYLSSNSLQSKTYWSACQSQLSSSIVQDMFCCDVCQSQLSSSIDLALVSHFGSTCRGGSVLEKRVCQEICMHWILSHLWGILQSILYHHHCQIAQRCWHTPHGVCGCLSHCRHSLQNVLTVDSEAC